MSMPFFDRQGRTPSNQRDRLSAHLRGVRQDPTDRAIAINVGTSSKIGIPSPRPENPDDHVAPTPDPTMIGLMRRRTRLA